MGRITVKEVQTVECYTNATEIYQDYLYIPWSDLAKWGIKKRKDKKTGKVFLLRRIEHNRELRYHGD